jgi:hypothetical protein
MIKETLDALKEARKHLETAKENIFGLVHSKRGVAVVEETMQALDDMQMKIESDAGVLGSYLTHNFERLGPNSKWFVKKNG